RQRAEAAEGQGAERVLARGRRSAATAAGLELVLRRLGRAFAGERLRRLRARSLIELRRVGAGVGVVVVERLPLDGPFALSFGAPREEITVARADDDLELLRCVAVDVADGGGRSDPAVRELRPALRLRPTAVEGVEEVAARSGDDLRIRVTAHVGDGVVHEERVVLDH